MAGIQIIIDQNKQIFLRKGEYINRYSAMCMWDDKLVLGNGSDGEPYPNLAFADWSTKTEEGILGTASWTAQTITSTRVTKNFDFELPDVEKQMRCIEVVYQDHPDWTGNTVTVEYRINQAGSGATETWTSGGTITLGTSTVNYKTCHYNIPIAGMSLTGKFFQFRFTTTSFFRISKMIFYYDILTKKY